MSDSGDIARKTLIVDYLSRGWALLALYGVTADGACTCRRGAECESAGKHPVGEDWRSRVLTDPTQTLAALGGPGCNVGIATGAASGIWVLDIDPDHGGNEALEKLAEEHGELPPTYRVTTGSGGRHFYWRMPDRAELTNSRGRLPAGIDVRGTGGQVVAPPSRSGRGGYRVDLDVMPEPAPEWLLDLLRPVPGKALTGAGLAGDPVSTSPAGADQRGRAYMVSAVAALCVELGDAAEGMRNQTAYRVACRLLELAAAPWAGLSQDAAYRAYSDAAERASANGTAPFSGHEAAMVWSSAARHMATQPPAALPESVTSGEVIPFAVTAVGGLSESISTTADVIGVQVAPTAPRPAGRTVRGTRASSITMRRTRYVWQGRWPVGVLTLIGGPVATGKSTVAYRCLAELTRGTLAGELAGQPRAVVIAAGEESWEHQVAPRLVAAGADLDLVLRVDAVTQDGPAQISLPADTSGLAELVRAERVAAIMCDPLISMLDHRMDSDNYQQVYLALQPVMDMAAATGVALVGITHLNKRADGDPLTRMMSSRAFSAAPRSVLMTIESPDREEGEAARWLLGHVKHSMGPLAETLEYRITSATVGADPDDGLPITSSRVEWLGASETTVAEAMSPRRAAGPARRVALEWLGAYLDAHGGQDAAITIVTAGKRAGHSRATLYRVIDEHGFSRCPPAPGFPARWGLPGYDFDKIIAEFNAE